MDYLRRVSGLVILFIYILWTQQVSVSAQTAGYLSIQSPKTVYSRGDVVRLTVVSNSGSELVNTVSAHIKYPVESVRFVRSDFTRTQYPSVVEKEETKGSLKYTAFIINGLRGTATVVDLYFEIIGTKTALISFEPTSGIYLADGSGKDIEDHSSPYSLVVQSVPLSQSKTVSTQPPTPTRVPQYEGGSTRVVVTPGWEQEFVDYTVEAKKNQGILAGANQVFSEFHEITGLSSEKESAVLLSVFVILTLLGFGMVIAAAYSLLRKEKKLTLMSENMEHT